jgi:hypothetical protein
MKTTLAARLVREEYLDTYFKPPAELDYEIMEELAGMAGSVLLSAHESLQTTKQLANA